MEAALAYLLDLRLRCRGNPEALAVVDRCLAIVARAHTADAATVRALEAEIEALRSDLESRFGPARPLVRN